MHTEVNGSYFVTWLAIGQSLCNLKRSLKKPLPLLGQDPQYLHVALSSDLMHIIVQSMRIFLDFSLS